MVPPKTLNKVGSIENTFKYETTKAQTESSQSTVFIDMETK
jgi:hypothetical protein